MFIEGIIGNNKFTDIIPDIKQIKFGLFLEKIKEPVR